MHGRIRTVAPATCGACGQRGRGGSVEDQWTVLNMQGETSDRINHLLQRYARDFPLMEQRRFPGFALCVLMNRELVFTACNGVEDVVNCNPIGIDTEFRIASLTKQFTAALILLLERDGLLSLDDPVRKYLPELDAGMEAVKLEHLCWNTSGIRDYFALSLVSGMTKYGGLSGEKIHDLIWRQRTLAFRPDSQERYSNSNYVLLVRIAELVSGKSYDRLLKDYIFEPLRMSRSRHLARVCEPRIGFAQGYQLDPCKNIIPADVDSDLSGEGGICSTLCDLIVWAGAFATGIPDRPGLMQSLVRRPRRGGMEADGYGFGLQIGRYRGRALEQHGGYIPGYRSQWLRFPEFGLTVIVLSNGPVDAGRLALETADICLDGFDAEAAPAAPAVVKATEHHRRYLGFYPDPEIHMGYSLREIEGELKLRIFGVDKPLYRLDERRLSDSVQSSFAFVMEFDPAAEGSIFVSTCSSQPRRILRSEGTAEDSIAIEGHYYSDELKVHYRIRTLRESYFVEVESETLGCRGRYPLRRLGTDIYRIDSELMDEVLLFFSNADNETLELRATIIRAEGVLFRKIVA